MCTRYTSEGRRCEYRQHVVLLRKGILTKLLRILGGTENLGRGGALVL